jgi:phosphosulfolactate phosphohydrolase-like enzyme
MCQVALESLGAQRHHILEGCCSALELLERGCGDDVALCLTEDASDVACRLQQGAFRAG